MIFTHFYFFNYSGQMEQTMMSTFCASANLHSFLNSDLSLPLALQQTLNAIKAEFSGDSNAFIFNGHNVLDTEVDEPHDDNIFPKEVHEALAAYLGKEPTLLSKRGRLYKHIVHRGLRYSTRSHSMRDSFIMMKATNDEPLAAQIEFIFTHLDLPKQFHAGVRRFQNSKLESDPYKAFPVFQGCLYSDLYHDLEIIRFDTVWCHFAHYQYDADNILSVPLDRASVSLCMY